MRSISSICGALLVYTGSMTAVQAAPAIAVWAYPDGASLPYRDDANRIIADSSARIGVAAYHVDGIARVAFIVQGETTYVDGETVNPETGEYEYVLTLHPDVFTADGTYGIGAVAYPDAGEPTVLPDLAVFKDTGTHEVYTVGTGGDYSDLDAACRAAAGGDVIKCRAGSYDLPDYQGYAFDRYVTIMPDDGAAVSIGGGSLRSSFMKFRNVRFDLTATVTTAVISSAADHFWFDGCTVEGYGKDVTDNNTAAFRFYTDSDHIVVENCEIHDAGFAVSATAGNTIIRNNHAYDLTSDGFSYNDTCVLITGNLLHNNQVPDSGTQHCDFMQTNTCGDQVVIRNNRCYNGDHQGIKFGAYRDRDQPFTNIAVVNNLFALSRASVSVNLRFQNQGKRYINFLVEHNTFWNGNAFYVDEDPVLEGVVVRNNIFGPKQVADMSALAGITISHNCYHAGTATGTGAVTGYPAFTDTSEWDFTLTAASPAIGGADDAAGVFYDLDWRIRDAAADIGPYEYLPVGAVGTPGPALPAGVRLPNPLTGNTHCMDILTLDGQRATAGTCGAVLVKVPGQDRYVTRLLIK